MRLAVEVAEYYVYPKSMGVSMGNPLGPMLVNMLVGFHAIHLFERHHKSHVYLHYVDDTFFFPFYIPLRMQRLSTSTLIAFIHPFSLLWK